MAMSSPFYSVSVVIPTKNEVKNIGWVLERVPEYVEEVILVDGLSKDGTVARARELMPSIHVIEERRPGKGRALRTGFEASHGDFVVAIDADGSMDPLEIGPYLSLLKSGFDLVKGSRYMEGGGSDDLTLLRRAGNAGLRVVANTLYRTSFSDLCYGFFAFRRSLLNAVPLDADGFEIEAQIFLRAKRAGLRISEVPTFESPRMYGTSSLRTFRDGWRILKTITGEHRAVEAVRSGNGNGHATAPAPVQIEEITDLHSGRATRTRQAV